MRTTPLQRYLAAALGLLVAVPLALASAPALASMAPAAGPAVGMRSSHGVAAARSHRPLVVVFGDSLITQASSQLATDLPGATIDRYSFPGLAACSYLKEASAFLRHHRPRIAILEFWGDDSTDTPCISRYAMGSPGYFAQYRANVSTMVHEYVTAGAHVFVVGTIPDAAQVASADPSWDELNAEYAAIASSYVRHVVTFLNVQRSIESDGRFTWYLPCLATEPSCDAPVAGLVDLPPAGNNVVRSEEGLHFCPLNPTTTNELYDFTHCDAYSSGTVRYAAFIAKAVAGFLASGRAPRYDGDPLPAPGVPETGVPGQVDPYDGEVYPQPAATG